MSFMDSEENRLLEKIHNCKTKHCSKELDEKSKYGVIYEKAHDIACPPNMKDKAFQKCDSDFYDKSDYNILYYIYFLNDPKTILGEAKGEETSL